MSYISKYLSPLGEIILESNNQYLKGLWFANQKNIPNYLNNLEEKETPIIIKTKKWLDIYFKGEEPSFTIPLLIEGTPFQTEVWHILLIIPYGSTMTYGEISKIIAQKRGLKRMSSQAIGGAIGKNKISIIIPCHRVIGHNGNLTGYASGLNNKQFLLNLENNDKKSK